MRKTDLANTALRCIDVFIFPVKAHSPCFRIPIGGRELVSQQSERCVFRALAAVGAFLRLREAAATPRGGARHFPQWPLTVVAADHSGLCRLPAHCRCGKARPPRPYVWNREDVPQIGSFLRPESRRLWSGATTGASAFFVVAADHSGHCRLPARCRCGKAQHPPSLRLESGACTSNRQLSPSGRAGACGQAPLRGLPPFL